MDRGPTLTTDAAVQIEGLSRRYHSGTGLGPITLTISSGAIIGLVGSNGAGKTTLLRMICGLVEPSEGSVLAWGEPVVAGRPVPALGAMIEEPALYPWATGRQHLELAAGGRRDWTRRIPAMLEEIGLTKDADRPTRSYSQGMRQRVGIARALLGRPRLLVLDEPTNGLDPLGVRWLRELLRVLAKDGTTVLVSSHLLGELHQLADRVLVLSAGHIVADLDAKDLGTSAGALDEAYFALVR
jgi:ABC-2 type transport system ATP-binding protein